MKTPVPRALHVILLLPALAGLAAADVPRKSPITKYARLWTDSPFTSKPPPPEPGPAVNPLEDYALAGVSPVKSGYRVTLLNKKKPDERIIVETDKPREGFSILGVTRKAGDPLGTVVRMQSGSVSGNVSFDTTLLTLAAPPAAKPPQPPPGVVLPPPQLGQPPQPGQQPIRQPRPRVVPPPTPNNGQVQGQVQPQVQPQLQPQGLPPGVRPGGQPVQNQQRPDRRR